MPQDMHTHNRLPIGAPPQRIYDTRNFYKQCGFDFFDQQRYTGERPAVQFAAEPISAKSARFGGSAKTITTTSTNSSTTSSRAPSVHSEDQDDVTSGTGYEGDESLAEKLKSQAVIDTAALSGKIDTLCSAFSMR